MRNERGAIIIHVAVALVALLAFLGIVLDQGAFYVARTQAHAAADAGALAGAQTLQFSPSDVNNAYVTARAFANQTLIWGQAAGDANIDTHYPEDCPDGTHTCLAIWVMRGLPGHDGAAHTNTFPTFLMSLVGRSTQGARAFAKAQIAGGNETNCLKPWMISDKYQENGGSATTFDPGTDVYIPPTPANEGTYTGYDLNDIGTVLTLKEGDPHSAIAPSDYYEIGDASNYREAIEGCVIVAKIGDRMDTLPGNRVGPTKQGTQALIDRDPLARWDSTLKAVVNSDPQYAVSPRIVPIAMFSPAEFYNGDRRTGNFTLEITNIMGFFVLDVDSHSTVTGVICSRPDLKVSGSGVADTAAFLKVIRLVQ